MKTARKPSWTPKSTPPKSISFSNRRELVAHLRKGMKSGSYEPMTKAMLKKMIGRSPSKAASGENLTMKAKSKRLTPAKRKKPIRDISADGQLEVRGNEILICEPLASKVTKICKREKITVRQFVIEAVFEKLGKGFNWPKSLAERLEAVETALHVAAAPVTAKDVAKQFAHAKAADILEILKTLETLGRAQKAGEGKFKT